MVPITMHDHVSHANGEIALDKAGISVDHDARYTLQKYIEWMATHMINQSDFKVK